MIDIGPGAAEMVFCATGAKSSNRKHPPVRLRFNGDAVPVHSVRPDRIVPLANLIPLSLAHEFPPAA